MSDHARLLDLIERTLDSDRACPACGAPNTVDDVDGSLWLICSATRAPDGLVQRLSAALRPHRRRLVLDPTDRRAA